MAKQIPVSGGKAYAIVDDEDYDFLMHWKWQILSTGHAYRTQVLYYDPLTQKQTKKTVLMHRVIMDAPEGMVVDHIDRNRLNNQRSNLRVCTQQENTQNKQKIRVVKSEYGSKYKGVQRMRNYSHETWRAHIVVDKKLKVIGTFKTEAEAARAYNQKAIEIHGEFAGLNQITE